MQTMPWVWIAIVMLAAGQAAPGTSRAPTPAGAGRVDPLQVQVMLDRAGFSPGAIDGRMGANTKKALAAFHAAGRQPQPVDATARYTITAADAAGPFRPVPSDMMEQATLPSLGYASLLEALAERFHAAPALIERLNPGSAWRAGDEIVVPNVEAMADPAADPPTKPDVTLKVSKSEAALRVIDAGGAVIHYAPVTTGSKHDPLPLGEWKVTGVQRNPTFRYNPDLFWDADPAHTKATIPAGPNNPVGLVWIDLSKEHYGLHGTAEPATIGRAQSHGCVRLTNWDALTVAALVKPGTRVVFSE